MREKYDAGIGSGQTGGAPVAADSVLDRFHPVVTSWFHDRFGAPTEPQRRGWPEIAAGRDTLIAAPTGSGKTLAAFLSCMDRLIQRGLSSGLPDRTQILYISPLKALSNDVHRNLEQPLAEIERAFAGRGVAFPAIRTAVRTGDTSASERSKMARKPPHILVTTPESMFILLTSKSGRAALSGVQTVIVDEIHAMARDKRGAHLTVSLERLNRLVGAESGGRTPLRIGLSATQKPIELIARMLGGAGRALPVIIDGGHARTLDVAIEMTDDELGAVASHQQMGRVYDRIARLVADHKTTLVFVNTRRMVERVAHELEQRLGEDQIVAHHGSMSRKLRFAAEQKLRRGDVRCAVATASLELGIDVGSVELVIQLGSPRSIATLLQRIGRSGHSLGATPKGRLFALTRDQLIECAALLRALRKEILDAVEPRIAPLDILAQQMVAVAACEDIDEDDLYHMIRGAFHYASLSRDTFDQVVHMLAEGVSDRRGRLGAHLHRDRINSQVKARRGARLAAITSGGAIPDNANYQVVLYPDEVRVGELDEDFAIDSSAGDVFLLGNTSWRIRRIETGRVLVEDARGAPPTVPFWFGEAPARTIELSDEISLLRGEVEDRLNEGRSHDEIARWVSSEADMPVALALQLANYLASGRASLGTLPTGKKLIAERFFDEAGGMQLVIHSPLGGRINRAWGLALRKRFCRSFNFELQAAATDDGIVISLGQPHSFPLDSVFRFLSSDNARDILIQALLDAPVFEIRWRWNVTRSLVLLRRRGGKRVAPHLLRMRANDLLSVVFPQQQACLETIVGDREVPDHPLVAETLTDCLTEAMDIDGLEAMIAGSENGSIAVEAVDTVEPSPLSHELLNANPYAFLDDAPLEERRTRAVSLRRGLSEEVDENTSALAAEAIARAEDEALAVVRDADELHDALLSLYAMAEPGRAGPGRPCNPTTGGQSFGKNGSTQGRETWLGLFASLVERGRATRLLHRSGDRDHVLWVAAERLPLVRAAYAGAIADPVLPDLPFAVEVPEVEAIDVKIVGAYLDHSGPRSGEHISEELGLPSERVLVALYALENDGAILRGEFTTGARGQSTRGPHAVEWCNRRILARIHRLTLARLRSQVEPVSAAALMRFLIGWQRVGPEHWLTGSDGLHVVIEQLQGFESAAGAWERELFPARLHNYDPDWLDSLCLSGQTAWCRLSPRRKAESAAESGHDSDRRSDRLAGSEVKNGSAASKNGNGENGASNSTVEGRSRARPAPTKAAPLAIMLRKDMHWLRAPAACRQDDIAVEHSSSTRTTGPHEIEQAPVSQHPAHRTADRPVDGSDRDGILPDEAALAVRDHLSAHGASFLSEIVASTGLAPVEVEDGLWELMARGQATADGFASLRVLVDRQRGVSRSRFDDRTRSFDSPRNRKWRDAVAKARRRERYRPTQAVRSLPTAAGRWSLLGPPDRDAIDAEATARQLLTRYGIVFRDLLVRESNLPPWRELLVALRRLEARGEIRGGRFVTGFVGEQFAVPEAVEALRALRNSPRIAELVRVPATDPLNLVGVTSPGPKVPAVIGNAILYRNGVPLASLEAGRVVLRQDLEDGARVDDDLIYHPPRRRDASSSQQASLPF